MDEALRVQAEEHTTETAALLRALDEVKVLHGTELQRLAARLAAVESNRKMDAMRSLAGALQAPPAGATQRLSPAEAVTPQLTTPDEVDCTAPAKAEASASQDVRTPNASEESPTAH